MHGVACLPGCVLHGVVCCVVLRAYKVVCCGTPGHVCKPILQAKPTPQTKPAPRTRFVIWVPIFRHEAFALSSAPLWLILQYGYQNF